MAKSKFNWIDDTRRSPETLASLEDWDEMASMMPQVLAMSEQSCIPLFVENASTIYDILETQGIEARRSAVLLQRHDRLSKLLDMFQSSNIIDFYFIKWPAWLLSEWLHRREERKMNHV